MFYNELQNNLTLPEKLRFGRNPLCKRYSAAQFSYNAAEVEKKGRAPGGARPVGYAVIAAFSRAASGSRRHHPPA